MVSSNSIIDRYEKKMKLVPIVKGYPIFQNHLMDSLVSNCYGTFSSQSIKETCKYCKVILEFDKDNSEQGIYLGCQLEENTDSPQIRTIWEPIVDAIKRDMALFWRSSTTANNRILEWDLKIDDITDIGLLG